METDNKNKICKFYLKGTCTKGDSCNYSHQISVKKRDQNEDNVNDNNKEKKNNRHNRHRRPRNTEVFTPDHRPSDMNILISKSQLKYKPNDVVIVPNFIEEIHPYEYYSKLLNEMDESGIEEKDLWKRWHENNHFIADDSLNWKEKAPTFNELLNKIEKYFNMKIKSTRFNFYENSTDFKPFHHDAASIKPHIAKIQNFTVGISLGATRDVAFEYAKSNHKTTVSIPLENCCAYAFSRDVNVNWKHGIPQVDPNKGFSSGRISIIAWGWVDME